MKNLPERLIRIDDGVEFVLNPRTKLYGLKFKDFEPTFYYTFDTLMNGPLCKGAFKIADGTEDLAAMQKRWYDSVISKNDGHGDDE